MNANTPRFSELLDWLEGRLPAEEARAVAERIESADAATQADLDWLRLFLQARQSVHFASPPPSVRETLKARFANYAEARQPPGLFQRLLAELTFDSRLQPATAGLRSATDAGAQRQLIYATAAAEIVVTIQSTLPNKAFAVAGQIFPVETMPAQSFSIQLLRDSEEVGLATADELGEFRFAGLPAGEYDMVVSAGQYEVIIPALQVQP